MLKVDSRNSMCIYDQESLATFKENLFTRLTELEDVDTEYAFKYLQKTHFKDLLYYCKKKKHSDSHNTSEVLENFYQISLTIIKGINDEMKNKMYDHIKDSSNINDIFDAIDTINENLLILDENLAHKLGWMIVHTFSQLAQNLKIQKGECFVKLLNEVEYDEEMKNMYESKLVKGGEEKERKTSTSSEGYVVITSVPNVSVLPTVVGNGSNGTDKSKFPKKLKLLVHLFRMVKSIKIEMPTSSKVDVRIYILLLLNIQWLFQNLLEVHIDFQVPSFQNVTTFLKVSDINQSHLNNDYHFDRKPLNQVVKEQKPFFELMLLIPFFVSSYVSYLNVSALVLTIPDSYTIELNHLLQKEKIMLSEFHLMNIFDMNTTMTYLKVNFNSLDNSTFHRLISIIHNNNHLKVLCLNMFPVEEYFTSYSLNKIQSNTNIFKQKAKSSDIIDENEYMMSLLYPKFEINLEFLIYIIAMKLHNMRELSFTFDIPGLFFLNDKYINTMHKFILNLFMMVADELKVKTVSTFELSSTNFVFDARKFPNLNTFIIDHARVNSNEGIKTLCLNVKMNQISSIQYLIPLNVEVLTLGEIDNKTFEELIPIIKNYHRLTFLKIGLCGGSYETHSKSDNIKLLMENFFQTEKSRSLNEIHLMIKFKIEYTFLENLISIIKCKAFDTVERIFLYVRHLEGMITNGENQLNFYIPDIQRMIQLIYILRKKKKVTATPQGILMLINKYLLRKRIKTVTIDYF